MIFDKTSLNEALLTSGKTRNYYRQIIGKCSLALAKLCMKNKEFGDAVRQIGLFGLEEYWSL
ncbi:hypothetical protein FACS189465_3620 [Clostridia bacterium]|nr:hypothetical protein FACS189465_3620 [Clostridia bacterium]